MRRVFLVAGIALAVVFIVGLRPARSSSGASESQITSLEQRWLSAEANNDIPALRRLIADDFIGTGPGGNILSKADIAPQSGGSNRIPKSSLRDSTVRIFGDTAVFMGFIALSGSADSEGFHVTTVYQKRNDGWQMIATHMSR